MVSDQQEAAPEAPHRRGAVPVFLLVTFAVTWGLWLPLLVRARHDDLDQMPWTYFLASAGPACGAVAALLWTGGPRLVARWARRAYAVRIGRRWWLLALGLPVGYYLVAWSVAAVLDGSWPDPARFGLTDKLPGLAWPLVAVVWVLTFGLGEESGWRGWLLPELARRTTTFWAALVVAGVWIGWHLPAFFFNPTYMAMGVGIVGWMLALVCGSYFLAWFTAGAQWSIVPVLVWHAGFDLLTAADQSSGVIASVISAVVMYQGIHCAGLLWRDRAAGRRPAPVPST